MLEIRIIRKLYTPSDEMLGADELDYDFIDLIDDEVVNMTISEFIDFIDRNGCGSWVLSSSSPSPWAWASNDGINNIYTGEHEEISLNCASHKYKSRNRWVRYLKAAQTRRLI